MDTFVARSGFVHDLTDTDCVHDITDTDCIHDLTDTDWVHDVTDPDCWAQNNSAHAHAFATYKSLNTPGS